jgi:MFS family permease
MSQLSGSGTLAPFQERNFRLFYVGQLVSMIGTWLQFVAEGWLVFELTRSPAWLGIVAGAGAAPGLLLTLTGGQVADRYSRRTILLITQALSMALAFVLALLASDGGSRCSPGTWRRWPRRWERSTPSRVRPSSRSCPRWFRESRWEAPSL